MNIPDLLVRAITRQICLAFPNGRRPDDPRVDVKTGHLVFVVRNEGKTLTVQITQGFLEIEADAPLENALWMLHSLPAQLRALGDGGTLTITSDAHSPCPIRLGGRTFRP